MPERIQLSRKKGWRMPENTVKVSRPSKWGNPFALECYWDSGYSGSAAVARRACVDQFAALMRGLPLPLSALKFKSWLGQSAQLDVNELRGKNLACWCPVDQPCHADVLLEIANS